MLKNPIVFFDLETTGIDAQRDRIVQIGAIKLYPDGRKEVFESLVNPKTPIPKEASDVHGITDEMVSESPEFNNISTTVLDMFYGCDIGGFNSNRFDVPMLAAEFQRVGVEFPSWDFNLVDVFLLESKLNPRTLSSVYKKYTGEELEGAHGALADIKATVEVFRHQLVEYELERSASFIEDMVNDGEPRADIAKKLRWINGELCYNFGKNAGKPVVSDVGYAKWMLGGDFPGDTKRMLGKAIGLDK